MFFSLWREVHTSSLKFSNQISFQAEKMDFWSEDDCYCLGPRGLEDLVGVIAPPFSLLLSIWSRGQVGRQIPPPPQMLSLHWKVLGLQVLCA